MRTTRQDLYYSAGCFQLFAGQLGVVKLLHVHAMKWIFKPGACQPQRAWFLRIAVSANVVMRVCVCPPRGY